MLFNYHDIKLYFCWGTGFLASCWVCQDCKAQSPPNPGHFSGLRVQPIILDKAMSPPDKKQAYSLLIIQAGDSPSFVASARVQIHAMSSTP